MARFDEVELVNPDGQSVTTDAASSAPLLRRVFALLTDLSLFAALTFALLPLLPSSNPAWSILALTGFIVVVSYYYFVGSWMLWRKTVGGTIFDVRVVARDGESMPLMSATMRWFGMWLSVLTGGLGFVIGLPNRLSNTQSA